MATNVCFPLKHINQYKCLSVRRLFFFSLFQIGQTTAHFSPFSQHERYSRSRRPGLLCLCIHVKSLTFPDVFVGSSVTRSNNRNLRLIAQADGHFLTVLEDTFIDQSERLRSLYRKSIRVTLFHVSRGQNNI